MMEQICRDDWIVDDSSLTPSSILGRGSQGSVTLMGGSRLRCYAKKASSIVLLNSLLKELNIMLRFHNHPNIIRATSSTIHFENNRNGERVCYIYMEYANKGSLEKMISDESHGKSLPEYKIQRAARMILQGLEALHANGYVHCDLKPANILLFHSTTIGEPFDLKLADFGLSKEPNFVSASLGYSTIIGTPLYMSPESLMPNGPMDPARDIWSLGCVVYEMFGGKAAPDMLNNYYEWTLVEDISPVAKDFLRQCHDMNPHSRATAAELLKHPFITQRLPSPRQQAASMMIPTLPVISIYGGYLFTEDKN